MRLSIPVACAVLCAFGTLSACGAARAPGPAPHAAPAPALEARGEVCPGWQRHQAAGRTLFALPGPATREERGTATAYVNAEGDVYFELVEEVVSGLDGGSDRAVIDGVLAGLGAPGAAELPSGGTVTAQGATDFEGRPAAERVIDIRGQVIRRERIVRAGDTMVIVVTMVRRDHEAQSAAAIRCFERSIVFAAPPSR